MLIAQKRLKLRIGLSMVLRPRQHSMGYIWQTGFTGQKTQPTYQSIEGKATKENQKKEKNTKYTYTFYTYKIVENKRNTYKAQQVP